MNRRPQFPDVDAADPSWWALPLALVLAVLGGFALSWVWSGLPRAGTGPVAASLDTRPSLPPVARAAQASAPMLDHSHLTGQPEGPSHAPTF